MSSMEKQTGSPVFEMILNATTDRPLFADASPSLVPAEENWQMAHQEGQLSVDVAETKNEVVVISTMAGSDTSQIEVYIHNDLLTIRGRRDHPSVGNIVNYFHQECYWGVFSRSIVLPVDVKADLARAEYKNGILIVKIPKRKTEAKIPIRIVEE